MRRIPMSSTETIVEQMDAAQAEAQAQHDKVDRDLQHVLTSVLPTWKGDAAREYEQAERAAADAKRAKIEAELTTTKRKLYREAVAALAAEEEAHEAAIYAALLGDGPQGVEQWREADHRRPFVEEDVARIPMTEIPKRYRLALDSKDVVGAFLWRRYGEQRIHDAIAEQAKAGNFSPDLHMLLAEMQALTGDKISPKLKAEAKRLDRLDSELKRRNPDLTREAVAAKYGIRTH
jgi:uncharacterized protein YukE